MTSTRTDGFVETIPRQPLSMMWYGRLVRGIVVGDIAAITASVLLASTLSFGPAGQWWSVMEASTLATTALLCAAWLVALSATKSRAQRILGQGATEYQRVLAATFVTFGSVAIAYYLLDIGAVRRYVAVALPTGLVLLVLNRLLWRRALTELRRRSRALTGALVVGRARDVDRAVTELRRHVHAGYTAVGISLTDGLAGADDDVAGRLESLPTVPYSQLVDAARTARMRAIVIAGELPGGRSAIRELGWAMERSSAELILLSRLTDVAGPRIHLRPIEGLPMVHVQLPRFTGTAYALKRALDVVLSALALVVLSPLLVAIALLVRRDGGPALFRQERVGVDGTSFTMLKFRSMVVDAEHRLTAIADADEGNGVLFKIRDDPRVTAVGRVLRRFSLDELPQLWNVFRGDMSLVGPRPPLPTEVRKYRGHETRRLLTKPGITGLWQVSGRSDLSWEDSIRLDLYYVENWSVTGDIVLLGRTVVQMFKPEGAY